MTWRWARKMFFLLEDRERRGFRFGEAEGGSEAACDWTTKKVSFGAKGRKKEGENAENVKAWRKRAEEKILCLWWENFVEMCVKHMVFLSPAAHAPAWRERRTFRVSLGAFCRLFASWNFHEHSVAGILMLIVDSEKLQCKFCTPDVIKKVFRLMSFFFVFCNYESLLARWVWEKPVKVCLWCNCRMRQAIKVEEKWLLAWNGQTMGEQCLVFVVLFALFRSLSVQTNKIMHFFAFFNSNSKAPKRRQLNSFPWKTRSLTLPPHLKLITVHSENNHHNRVVKAKKLLFLLPSPRKWEGSERKLKSFSIIVLLLFEGLTTVFLLLVATRHKVNNKQRVNSGVLLARAKG
jgi:hypothetical protein